MADATTKKEDHNDDDKWADTAGCYANQAARLTEHHGADLIALLRHDILRAKTILDVGAGTGAFEKAYLQQFPQGIPGQTIWVTDLSSGMLEQARATIQPPAECATTFVFSQEDGTKLTGIQDNSIDIVVSLFGVFLIPDQTATCHAIQRVLRQNGIFANAAWQFGISQQLQAMGYGPSLQDAFKVPTDVLGKLNSQVNTSFDKWSNKESATLTLTNDCKFTQVDVVCGIHTSIWEFPAFWDMLLKNPCTNLQEASEEEVETAKDALLKFWSCDGTIRLDLNRPLAMTTVSNLCIGRQRKLP